MTDKKKSGKKPRAFRPRPQNRNKPLSASDIKHKENMVAIHLRLEAIEMVLRLLRKEGKGL